MVCVKGLKYTVAPTQILKQGLIFNPNDNNLWLALEQALCEMCKFETARKICDLRGVDADLNSNEKLFNRQFLSLSHSQTEDLCKTRQGWASHWEMVQKQQSYGPLYKDLIQEPNEGRRLRVGYLSADFCNHPVGRFLIPVIKNHDRKKVEVWGISCGPHRDWISEQLQSYFDHWLDCQFHNDALAARLIADLRLDVLVELGGYTSGSRLGILVHRPAPVN